MKRKAFIIGSPGNAGTESYLPGTINDVKAYKAFLQSPIGGGWYENEIVTGINPSRQNLINALRGTQSDYTVFVFSGHGFTNQQNVTNVVLNGSNEQLSVPVINQLIKAPKKLFIIDACRSWVNQGIGGVSDLPIKKSIISDLTIEESRRIFNTWIKTCDKGTVVLYSCKRGQSSTEDSLGGFFSRSLLASVRSWSQIRETHQAKYLVLPADVAISKGRDFLRSNFTKDQYPITNDLSARTKNFPFAVKKTWK